MSEKTTTATETINNNYDTIGDELRFLSKLHRMKERAGFVNSNACGFFDNNNDSYKSGSKNNHNSNDVTSRHKDRVGSTKTRLRRRNMIEFKDEDYYCLKYKKDNEDDKHDNKFQFPYRRFQLFNRFARSVCKIQAIPRKELFEAWAMALYVHECFLKKQITTNSRSIKRFADLACSHGLLSWALLLLSSEEEEEEEIDIKNDDNKSSSITAVCIDKRMPKSSETAARIFFEDYPQFCNDGSKSLGVKNSSALPDTQEDHESNPCWDYVEGPIESIVPDHSTLLVGIHACGRLSDSIIDLAIQSKAPLALVPCCHSKKFLTPGQADEFETLVASASYSSDKNSNNNNTAPTIPSYSLADFTDAFRKQRLVEAGYTVQEVTIPEEFTPKNRIILAIPPPLGKESKIDPFLAWSVKKQKSCKGHKGMPLFDIPIADTEIAKTAIRLISGREAATQRIDNAYPPPAICVSVWLPIPVDNATSAITTDHNDEEEKNDLNNNNNHHQTKEEILTVESLQKVMSIHHQKVRNIISGSSSAVRVEDATYKPCHRFTDGRLSKTFRVHYLDCKNNKAKAKECHRMLREVILPMHFPTVSVRND